MYAYAITRVKRWRYSPLVISFNSAHLEKTISQELQKTPTTKFYINVTFT